MNELETNRILANSFESGWDGVNSILQQEICGEIPGAETDFHTKFYFVIIVPDNVWASYKTANGWQHLNYQAGDIVILPQAELFPQIIVDSPRERLRQRDVPLLSS